MNAIEKVRKWEKRWIRLATRHSSYLSGYRHLRRLRRPQKTRAVQTCLRTFRIRAGRLWQSNCLTTRRTILVREERYFYCQVSNFTKSEFWWFILSESIKCRFPEQRCPEPRRERSGCNQFRFRFFPWSSWKRSARTTSSRQCRPRLTTWPQSATRPEQRASPREPSSRTLTSCRSPRRCWRRWRRQVSWTMNRTGTCPIYRLRICLSASRRRL